MKQQKPKTLTAHVELLSAVDNLILQAEQVRKKREALARMIGQLPTAVLDAIAGVEDHENLLREIND